MSSSAAASLTSLAFAACILLTVCGSASAQDDGPRVCGTEDVDIEITRANIAAAKAFAKTHHGAFERGAITYIPLRFKRIGDSDGTREATPFSILALLEAINRDFVPYDWRFYLADVDGTPFTTFFDDDLNEGLSDDRQFLQDNRSRDAVTMYLVANASTSSASNGVTLGYYDSGIDILVVRTGSVGSDASTATHELGHYFGLPHTFRGWDAEIWEGGVCSDTVYNSPVAPITAPNRYRGRSVPVELVTRGDGANCADAGDLFCDTGADYNLGLGYPGCNYRGPVVDRNGDALQPNEDNFMSYFQDCPAYEFSEEQFAAVAADYRSARRAFLREGSGPSVLDTVTARAVVTAPANNAVTDFFDDVTVAWDSVEYATYYYLEVNTQRSFSDRTNVRQEVLPGDQTSALISDLEAGQRYYIRVTGFNQLTLGLPSTRVQFRTGAISSVGVPEAVEGIALAPNPVARGRQLAASLHVGTPGAYAIAISDAVGRQVYRRDDLALSPGSNRIAVPTAGLAGGAYVLRVSNDRGVTSRRFLVR